MNVARAETPSGAIFYEKKISPTLRIVSRNIFSERQTSIQSVEWSARKDIRMALSSGIGNNQGYAASSFALDKRWLILDASYAFSGDNFRRVLVDTPQLSENDRENIRLEVRPISNVRIIANRNNYFSYIPGEGVVRATVDGVAFGAAFAGFQTYGSWFGSSTAIGSSEAIAVGGRRRILRHLEAGADFLRSSYSKGSTQKSVGINLREILNSRFSVTQVINHNAGQTTVDFGGNFLSNFVSVSVDYQTVFLPFVQNTPGALKQIMVVGLHFQLPHGMQFNVDSDVTPLGQIRYTAYASTYAYRGMGRTAPGTSFSGAFLKNVVRGEVLDPDGLPIEGAAVQIGPELAVTDSQGNFMVRFKKAGELDLKIDFDDFTAPGRYTIVQAPAKVAAVREDTAQEYTVVLKRMPNGGASAAAPSQETNSAEPPEPSK